MSAHPDINELMFVADALVTDYSSAIFEYSLLQRPMAFFLVTRTTTLVPAGRLAPRIRR